MYFNKTELLINAVEICRLQIRTPLCRIRMSVMCDIDEEWADFDKKELTAKVLGIIDREWIALKLNELFVVEYYSRKI